jgi:hypothetical protein
MSDSPLVLRNGNHVSSADEIYPRNRAGQYGKKLGVVGDLVPALNCYRIMVVETRDEERIIAAIKTMLEDDRLQDLKFKYQAIVDSFQTYVDHEQADTLGRTQHLCTEAAPQFKGAFEGALTAFNPYLKRNYLPASVRASLDPLITAADAYLIVLSIGFHSRTKLTPSSARNDRVVLPQIEAAIKLLEDRLQYTLLPSGTAKKSPMAALLFSKDMKGFLHFYPFCKGYEGVAGVVQMVAEANEKEPSKFFEGYSVSSNILSEVDPYIIFADTLIELIARFKALRSIRLDFDPDADSQVDPRAILAHAGDDTLALTAEVPNT